MNTRNRIIGMFVLLLFASAMLFAGGQGEQQAASGGKEVITWWALSSGGGAEDPRQILREQIIADYEAQNPDVTIDLVMLDNEAFKQKIQVAIQAGTPPDIFHSWGGGVMIEYAEAGMLRDITDEVKNNLSNRIGLGPLGVYGYDGRYFGSPYDMGAVGFWYNKDIFAEVGVSVPETWADLLRIVPQIRQAGYVPIALGAGDKWPAHFWWVYLAMRMGGQEAFNRAYDGRGSFADQPFVRAGELLLQLNALNPFQTGFLGATYDDQGALMGNGEAAMELMGQWAPGVQAANSVSGEGIGDALGWFSFPAVAGGQGKLTDVMGGGNGYVLGKDASDAALDFLDFFLQEKYNVELVDVEGIVPVVAGAESALEGNANLIQIADAVANAGYYQLYYDQFLPPAVGEAVKDAVAKLLAGVSTPAQTAQEIQASWQANK
ncbi:extracellular solute-binding protein [Spirochaeta lutea]|uniref:ABC transporter substrate-binding protein n=1 Tax=Spirochaeta lutea TaxID=1480694 RepID=A0A098QTD9_9SPIO|nr:extracellular solute-binding protein [Spirochaeta lutea]KGE70984.1 ABC transporter substrate-binding protein [Spirochaeta lutea]